MEQYKDSRDNRRRFSYKEKIQLKVRERSQEISASKLPFEDRIKVTE